MLFAGKNIQSSTDRLVKIDIDYLYHSIKNPKPEIAAKIRQLRIIRELDKKSYTNSKRQLPYIVCGAFNPPYRKGENFSYIEHFIVDLDYLMEKEINIQQLKEKLKSDNRIALMFISPSQDGLKLLFNLSKRCMDAGLYSIFYKKFVELFAIQYNLEQVVDKCTSDVSRACFISIDEDVYYNPQAELVEMDDYIDEEDTLSLFEINHLINKQEKDIKEQSKESVLPKDPDADTLNQIKIMLGSKKMAERQNKLVYVPDILNDIIDGIKLFIEEQGINVYEIKNIQYAKKIRCKLGSKRAEINLFYGKKGFSTIISPANGTSNELNEIVVDIVNLYLQENT